MLCASPVAEDREHSPGLHKLRGVEYGSDTHNGSDSYAFHDHI